MIRFVKWEVVFMVVTVTLNPAIDVTGRLDALRSGETNRFSDCTVNAGGKGINAARLVKTLGGGVLAVGFAGGWFAGMVDDLEHRFIPVGETRVNTKIIDGTGRMTELNGPGVPAGAEAYRSMEALLLDLCEPGTVFVLSGSLPPDAEPGLYAGYIQMLRGKGAKVVLDASGEALRLGFLAGPDVVKPNRDEMEMIGRSAYAGLLANSLGAEGARFRLGGKELFIPNLPLKTVSPAGAGDCMTGALAYALERGLPFEEAAFLSMAAANAAVTMPGTLCPPLERIEECRRAFLPGGTFVI
jgi:1-phosphofructokinase